MEADERDRQREREEMEEIRRRLMEEGHPDPEAEMARVGIIQGPVVSWIIPYDSFFKLAYSLLVHDHIF